MNFFEYLGDKFQDALLWVVRQLFGPANLFDDPWFLLLLLFIPAYLFWYVWWYAPRRLVVPLSYDPNKLAPPKFDLSFLRVAPHVINMVAIFFMVIALARPITRNERQNRFTEGIDIMLILDTSGSMETDDFKPNRLEVAKETAIDFIKGRTGDQIGIVLFAEDAFGYSPLTLDYDLLKTNIEAIDSDIMPKEGTAMGSAIAVGINKMSQHDSPSKVMILLTDGASNRGEIEPITAAGLAKDNGIKIYTIGIGKENYKKQTVFGVQTISSDLNEESLQEVADITSGKFFRSENKSSLESIFDEISRLEKVEIKGEVITEKEDHYGGILLIAGILMGASLLIALTFVYNPLEG